MSGWLNSDKIDWNLFADKQSRPLKVMARGPYSGTESAETVEELVAMGFLAISTVKHPQKIKQSLNFLEAKTPSKQKVLYR